MHKQVYSIADGSIFGVMRTGEAIDAGLVGRTPAVSAVRGISAASPLGLALAAGV
jgi:hypothetical protein